MPDRRMIDCVLDKGTGTLNALLKNLTKQLGVADPNEAIRLVNAGMVKVEWIKHLINCDAAPFCPNSWTVIEHKKGGIFEWSPDKIRLHLEPEQKRGAIEGNLLRERLEKQPVLNANVLDYLLKHQELIPEDWKGKAVFFWGTIYRYSDGNLCVRYLRWNGDRWYWNGSWLGGGWDDDGPALLSQV